MVKDQLQRAVGTRTEVQNIDTAVGEGIIISVNISSLILIEARNLRLGMHSSRLYMKVLLNERGRSVLERALGLLRPPESSL